MAPLWRQSKPGDTMVTSVMEERRIRVLVYLGSAPSPPVAKFCAGGCTVLLKGSPKA